MYIILAVLSGILLVYLIQYKLYAKKSFDGITYNVTLNTAEVFEGEDVLFYEEISNTKWLPLPFLKVETYLPGGLRFRLIQSDSDGKRRSFFTSSIQSVFVLKPYETIRRTWRVNCDVRGAYTLGEVMAVTNDLIGFNQQSRQITVPPTARNQLVVLPRTLELDKEFTSSKYLSGDILVRRSIVSDPLRIAGVREYVNGDPMNRINWKSTAAHNALMVNVEEYTQRHSFRIILNMNSRDIERVPGPPAIPSLVEDCITIVASILDTVATEHIGVRIVTNVMPDEADPLMSAALDDTDEIGKSIFISPSFFGTTDMIAALRFLARLPMRIDLSVEKMLDHIVAHPEVYVSDGNLVFVSAYISERMIYFAKEMEKRGVSVIFYITGSVSNAAIIPDNVKVFFKIKPEAAPEKEKEAVS
ncbi:MAG: DUF58 domain-containing protein [Clostridia bacterium]|nr:DUF58 domain-containing protein [Clostridia bacterium]